MSESESENVPKSSATPEESRQPGSSILATPILSEERDIILPGPEPVPSTSGLSWKGKTPAHPKSRSYKKKKENLEESIISAFEVIKITGKAKDYDSSDEEDYITYDNCGEGDKKEEKDKKREKSSKKNQSVMLELSVNPTDTYPQVCDEEDEPRPSTSFSSAPETGTPENENQPVSEENVIKGDAPAPALASPPPHLAITSPLSEDVMSSLPFHNLRLSKEMIKHLRDSLGITTATILQEKAIPILMWERDAFMHAASGSGKTVAFTVPLIHRMLLIKPKVRREDGIRILVVVPNKECARKTYQTFVTMLRSAPWIEVGLLGGGDRFRMEKETVRIGSVILVTTPLRFLDHLRNSDDMFLKNLSCLVVDGVDEIFERGDRKHLSNLITVLDKGPDYLHQPDQISVCAKEHVESTRQTIFVSSTITEDVAYFTGLYTTDPMMIDDKLNSPPRAISLPVGKPRDEKLPPPLYNQFFMIVPERMKLVALVGFVMWKYKVADERRILVFAGTQTMADYFAELFLLAYGKKDPECEEESADQLGGLNVYVLNPFMSQKEKLELFAMFSRTMCGILFCTDSAVKGVDLPRVDWVIHLHAPTCTTDYMARIGMASPGFQVSSSLTLLLSAEKEYVQELKNHDIPLTSMKVRQSFRHLWTFYPPSHTIDDMIFEIQTNIEDIVHQSPQMHDNACMAFASWCRLYSSYPQNLKHIFRFTYVHMDNYVHSFGLREQSAFVIRRARKLQKDVRRKPAKKRSAPAEVVELPLEPSPKLPFPQNPMPDPAPVAAEHDDPMNVHAAESRKRKNDEGMEQSDGEGECPEKRSK